MGNSCYYDVDTNFGESHGAGIFDTLKNVASSVTSKLTSKATKKVAEKAVEKLVEKGVEKVGEKTGQLIGEKIYDKFSNTKPTQPPPASQENKGIQIIEELRKKNGQNKPVRKTNNYFPTGETKKQKSIAEQFDDLLTM